jgi:hypothetical protein
MRSGQEVPALASLPLGEWLIADGLGGSASGSTSGRATRRTHALLTAAGPHGRPLTLLLRFDERATAEAPPAERAHATLTPAHDAPPIARLPGTAPAGTPFVIESFAAAPWPTWRCRAGDTRLEKSVFALRGHSAVVASYRHLDGPPLWLVLTPLVAARDPHGLQREDPAVRGTTQGVPGRVRIDSLPGSPALTLWHNGAFLPARVWRHGLRYPLDGGAATEDALVPGHIEATLAPGGALHVVASTEEALFRALAAEERLGTPPPRTLAECVDALAAAERATGERWLAGTLDGADFTARQAAAAHGSARALPRRLDPLIHSGDTVAVSLVRTLDAGLTRRGRRVTVLPSLPGGAERADAALRAAHAFVTLRAFGPAREIVRGYLEHLDEGVAPGGFNPEDGGPLYGDPAASLWLVSAGEFYVRRSGDTAFLADPLFPALEGVLHAYRAGTRHGIRVGTDGLLAAGPGGERRADLNALWYHALVAMAQLARVAGRKESGAFYLAWAREHQARFNEAFWDVDRNEPRPIAAGVVDGSVAQETPAPAGNGAGAGRALTPSLALAASLAPAVLPPDRATRLLQVLDRELATPAGLREAAGAARVSTDGLGPFLMGLLRSHQRAPDVRERVRRWIGDLLADTPPGAPARIGVGAQGEDPFSILAAADLLRVWIEEMDHPARPASDVTRADGGQVTLAQ